MGAAARVGRQISSGAGAIAASTTAPILWFKWRGWR